ncbi:MAG: DUF494 family protein [Bacteroidota bacterium]|nr:DUF494 family protein [Bacteroidota bacterium]
MQDRIIEIIVYVLNEIKTTQKSLQEIDVQKLEKLGFTTSEMNAAFSWLFDRLYLAEMNLNFKPSEKTNSHRILHDVEKLIIMPEAYGYLLQLRELEIVSNIEMEFIIERIMINYSHSVDLREMIAITASIIFQKDEHVLGSSSYDNETIN